MQFPLLQLYLSYYSVPVFFFSCPSSERFDFFTIYRVCIFLGLCDLSIFGTASVISIRVSCLVSFTLIGSEGCLQKFGVLIVYIELFIEG